MDRLADRADRVATLLRARGETVSVAESSTGGLVSAALLAIPGASTYFVGGAVIYTRQSRRALLGITNDMMGEIRSASEPYAAMLAARMRDKHATAWGLAETGAAGPTGNSYGDAAGHSCLAVSGAVSRTLTLETGSADRPANMRTFAAALLDLFIETLSALPKDAG